MTNKILIAALAIFGILGLSFAWGGFFMNIPDEAKEQMQEAFEAKDFETMKALREQYAPQVNETLMEETNAIRDQIHDAMVSGDYETAKELHEQFRDLMPGRGIGHGTMGPRGMHRFEGECIRPMESGSMQGFGRGGCNCPGNAEGPSE
ncbi:hypothetical protein JXA56_01330 [Candidatus Micrarchaeota archaeon]|nr:hypothetical protein [Candidatus Micrarchaeota archaeon]